MAAIDLDPCEPSLVAPDRGELEAERYVVVAVRVAARHVAQNGEERQDGLEVALVTRSSDTPFAFACSRRPGSRPRGSARCS